jgi:hypothetical protein
MLFMYQSLWPDFSEVSAAVGWVAESAIRKADSDAVDPNHTQVIRQRLLN